MAGKAAGAAITASGGSPSQAANTAAAAAVGAGASREDAARIAGEAAGEAVVHGGGTERDAGAAAAEAAREAGGSAAAAAQVTLHFTSLHTRGLRRVGAHCLCTHACHTRVAVSTMRTRDRERGEGIHGEAKADIKRVAM